MSKIPSSHSPMMMHTSLMGATYGLTICPDSLSGCDAGFLLQMLDFILLGNMETNRGDRIITSRCSVCQGVRMSFHDPQFNISDAQDWFKRVGATAIPSHSNLIEKPLNIVRDMWLKSLLQWMIQDYLDGLQNLHECLSGPESALYLFQHFLKTSNVQTILAMGESFALQEKNRQSDPTYHENS